MRDRGANEVQQLAEMADRLKQGRQLLSMTIYAASHGRRTPEQVRAVLERSTRAIQRNRLVRLRWTRTLAIH